MGFSAALHVFVLVSVALAVQAKKEEAVKPLTEAESSASGSGAQNAEVGQEKVPKFRSMAEQLKWKLNKAGKRLRVAKQYVALADKVAFMKHKHNFGSNSVKDIIKKAEVALVHAGEKFGLDYVHFKRSVDYQ